MSPFLHLACGYRCIGEYSRCTNKKSYYLRKISDTWIYLYFSKGRDGLPSCFLIDGHALYLLITDPDLSSIYFSRYTSHSDNINGSQEKTSATKFFAVGATQHRLIISAAMSHKPPMLSNTGTRDKVRNSITFWVAVNEVDGVIVLFRQAMA